MRLTEFLPTAIELKTMKEILREKERLQKAKEKEEKNKLKSFREHNPKVKEDKTPKPFFNKLKSKFTGNHNLRRRGGF